MNASLPPPLPSDENAINRARQAATASLAVPLILIALRTATRSITATNQTAHVILDLISLVLILLGLGAAIYALVSTSRLSQEGVLGRSLGGLFINGGLVLIFITNFMGAAQKTSQGKAEVQKVDATMKDIQEDLRKDMKENDGMVSSQEHLKRIENEFEKASKNLSGVDKQVMQVNAAFAKRMAGESAKYEAAAKVFQEAAVLDPASNSTLEKIVKNRATVTTFLAANESFTTYLKDIDQVYNSIIQEQKLSPKPAAELLAGFKVTSSLQKPLLTQIRSCDARVGKASLGVLDIFETHFGKWKVEAGTGDLVLPDETIEKYQKLMAEVDDAAQDQTAAQEKLLNLKY